MTRLLAGLVLGGVLAAGWCALAAEEPAPKKLTPEERKELEAKWKELNSTGTKHYQVGHLVEATEWREKGLAAARQLYPPAEFPDGHPNLALSLNELGFMFQARAKYAEAEPPFREALEMRRRLYRGQDHSALALSLNNLAYVLQVRGQYGEAEPLFRDALEMRGRLYPKQDHPDLALSLKNLAYLLQARAQYGEAEPLFRDALEMYRRLYPRRDHPELARSLNNLAVVLQARGRYWDAEPLFREALEMRRRLYPRQDHPDLAGSLNSLASVLQARGQYGEAETLNREALEMNRRLYPRQYHPGLARSLNSLALLLQVRGKFAEAEPLYRDALEMRRRLYPRQNHPDLAGSLNNLASVLQARDNYAEAEQLYRDALEMRRRLYPRQDHDDLAMSFNNLAFLLQARGQYAEAEPLFRETLEMFRRLYPRQDHPKLVQSLNNLAYVLQARGQYAEAEPLYRDALEMHRRFFPRQDHRDLATSLNNLALLLQARGQYADAEPLFREALRMHRALARAYAVMGSEGDALTLAASYPLARDNFLSNARALQGAVAAGYAEVWSTKANLARIYEQRALRARAAAANPEAAALLGKLTDGRRRRAELVLAPQPADPASRQQRDDDLERYAREIEVLDRQLRPLLPAVDRAEKLARATPADLQQALPADAAVVDFLRYTLFEQDPNRPGAAGEKRSVCYLAFVIAKGKVAGVDLGPAAPIEEAIAAWREAITGGKDIPAALPTKVRELTWAKLRTELPVGMKVVYVCPDVALCRLPWAALPGDRPGTILLEDHAVAILPHAPFLLDKLWPAPPLRNRPAKMLVIGGVAYDADPPAPDPMALHRGDPLVTPGQKVVWAALPGAAAEAKGVAAVAGQKKLDSHTLGGDRASAAAVLAALPQARYAHLATHGFFADASFRSAFQVDPKLFEQTWRGERVGAGALSPLVMTGLVFAGANKPDTPGRGVLTGEALVDLDLSGLELAVLSACETGLGDVAGGEGTFGLQRAFHLAGTRNVIASLWKVPDRTTAALMALFYRNLWDKDMPAMEALRQAQLEIYRHPEKVSELAAGFRGKFQEVPGTGEGPVPPGPDGKAHSRLWAAFTLSGPGR